MAQERQIIMSAAVVGAGIMGHGIAQVLAHHGVPVTMYDINEQVLATALDKVRSNLTLYVEAGLKEPSFVDETMDRITATPDLAAAVAGKDVVIEAAPEILELKQDLFSRLERSAPDDALLASNSSMLAVTRIAERVKNKERVVGTHWFNPPHLIPVVEVIRGEHTSDRTVERTVDFLRRMGKVPVKIRKEVPGFLINRIQTAMFREMVSLLQDGVADAEDIDRAVKGSFGLRLAAAGPLEIVDLGGLDLWTKGAQYLFPLLDDSKEPHRILKEKVAAGHTGKKAGQGFFTYKTDEVLADEEKARDLTLLRLLSILYPE